MELHDNHIRIYRSILQVLQSLGRDNHGIFIRLVLFETWLCCVSNLQFFSPWEPASHFFPQSLSQINIFSFLFLSPRPRTLVKRKQKVGPPSTSPKERPLPPTSEAGQNGASEKLQFVCITPSVRSLSCCSVYKVNLSWGICHGSSCFCI